MHQNRIDYSLQEYQEVLLDRWQKSILWLGDYDKDNLPRLFFARVTPKTVWLPGKPREKYYRNIFYRLNNQLKISAKRYSFLTLTYDHKKYTPETAAMLLPDHIKEFFRLIRKRYKKVEYFWIVELTKNGYPHIHLIINQFLFWKVVRAIWYQVTGSKIIDIRSIPAGNLAGYVCKYVAKQEKQNQDQFSFIFSNISRLWNSSRGFFTKGDPKEKRFILLGFSGNCWSSDDTIMRPNKETEIWEIDYDFAVPLLMYNQYIERSLRDKPEVYQFKEDMFALFENNTITALLDKIQYFWYHRTELTNQY
jgi:hypothetical protein